MEDHTFTKIQRRLSLVERTIKKNEDGTYTVHGRWGENDFTEEGLLRLACTNRWLDEISRA